MTRPGLVAFARGDGPVADAPKIFLRTLLYSTGSRGHALESLFIRARQGDTLQAFLFWGYGESEALNAGSGLFIGPEGHVANHHFLLTEDAKTFRFELGPVTLELFGTFAGKSRPALLHTVALSLSEESALALRDDPTAGIFSSGTPMLAPIAHIPKNVPASLAPTPFPAPVPVVFDGNDRACFAPAR